VLATQPEARYSSAEETLAALDHLDAQPLGSAAQPPRGPRWRCCHGDGVRRSRAQSSTRHCHLVLHDTARLLTSTGTGGTGKTRLELEVASRLAARYRGRRRYS
jgi:hypothetical protein